MDTTDRYPDKPSRIKGGMDMARRIAVLGNPAGMRSDERIASMPVSTNATSGMKTGAANLLSRALKEDKLAMTRRRTVYMIPKRNNGKIAAGTLFFLQYLRTAKPPRNTPNQSPHIPNLNRSG
jgi:hypothetical protein